MSQLRILATILVLVVALPVLAVIETYEFSSPELERRYRQLSGELRCPKCQNQNIADSNAPIAQDLRRLLYQQLEAGASNEEILDYMVSRYGEFVRYRPSFKGPTLILWLAPILLLIAALAVVLMVLRKRSDRLAPALDAAEQQRLQSLLAQAENDS